MGCCERTMTVFPLYWIMWHDRPTSFPPPKHRNMSSSDGSKGSSETEAAMADALRLDAIVLWLFPLLHLRTDTRELAVDRGQLRPMSVERGEAVVSRRVAIVIFGSYLVAKMVVESVRFRIVYFAWQIIVLLSVVDVLSSV